MTSDTQNGEGCDEDHIYSSRTSHKKYGKSHKAQSIEGIPPPPLIKVFCTCKISSTKTCLGQTNNSKFKMK